MALPVSANSKYGVCVPHAPSPTYYLLTNAHGFTTPPAAQLHGDSTRSLLSLNYYTELKRSKGIVLLRGEYDKDALVRASQPLGNPRS